MTHRRPPHRSRRGGFLPLLFACLTVASVAGAQTLSTIRSNAPLDRRLNLVVLAEGYTAAQQGTFRTDATNTVLNLLKTPPFSAYSNCFNAFALSVASNQSGSDHPDQGTYRDTYFETLYTGAGNPQLIDITPSGLTKVQTLIATHLPACDVPILLVNDPLYGGSGGAVLIANRTGNAPLLTHEMGHTLAGLGDEYETPWPGYTSVEEPNTTQQTNRALLKWNAWVDPATPVPTPPGAGYDNYVGLFQGANYHSTGWYRPRLTCRMRELDQAFCEVCTEALVLSIYRKVRPIQAFSPTTNLVVSVAPQTLNFSVNRIPAPAGVPVFQWTLNGAPVAGATRTSFSLATGSLGNGLHTLRAEVRDATTLVRTDPTNALRQTNTWQVQVAFPVLTLAPLPRTPTNGFGVRVTGSALQGIILQASTNLLSWQNVATNAFTGGSYQYFEPVGSSTNRRYYRARGQ
jgi:hypothetical protein